MAARLPLSTGCASTRSTRCVDDRAIHFLEQLAVEVDALSRRAGGRPLFLIAESDLNDPRMIRRASAGGYGLDAQWSDDFHHALHATLTGERQGYYADFGALAALAKALQQGFVYDGDLVELPRALPRPAGRPAMPALQFVVYLQNHDQVGNRAVGDRLRRRCPTGCCGSAPRCC